jgi:hypothetical protein
MFTRTSQRKRKSFVFLFFFLSAFLLSFSEGVIVSRQTNAAQDCSMPGFFRAPCDGFTVQRQDTPNGKILMLMHATDGFIALNALPFSDRKESIESLIQDGRREVAQQGVKAQEGWIQHHGARLYQFLSQNRGYWIGKTSAGHVIVMAQWKNPQGAVNQRLQAIRVEGGHTGGVVVPPTPPPAQGSPTPPPAQGSPTPPPAQGLPTPPPAQGSPTPPPAQEQPTGNQEYAGWRCDSEGIVQNCKRFRYRTSCITHTSRGIGVHKTKSGAISGAMQRCISSRTSRFIIGNYPSGSQYYYNFSRYGAPCRITRCIPLRN